MNVKWLFNQCRRRREAIGLLAAGSLPEAERQALEQHLAVCPACRERFDEVRAVARQLAEIAAAPPETPFDEDFHLQVAQAIRNTGLESTSGSKSETRFVWWPWGWNRAAWGALAAMWALVLFFNLSAPSTSMSSAVSRPMSARELLMVFRADPETLERLVARPETGIRRPALPGPQTRRRGPYGQFTAAFC